MQRTAQVLIASFVPYQKNLNLTVIVLQPVDTVTTRDGKCVHTFLVADVSAAIELSLWGDEGSAVQSGDILRIESAFCNLFQQRLRLYVSKKGKLERTGAFTALFSESLNVSADIEWMYGSSAEIGSPGEKSMIPVRMTAKSYEQFVEKLPEWLATATATKAKGIFVYFYATENEQGISWCPDCVTGNGNLALHSHVFAASPVVRSVFKDKRITLFQVSIDRSVWKAADPSANPFKSVASITKLTNIPTLAFWNGMGGHEDDRLIEADCFESSNVSSFVTKNIQ